ncbi:MAG: hypothetical protein GYB68_02645, partial [Chloroflexi bacterium]|nr:hypothetical protein [Chloroflexota bacterium]
MLIRRLPLLLFTTLFILMLLPDAARAQTVRPVLVYYYAWWYPEALGPGQSPDWPETPYHSWDTAVLSQHVSQAASAGIDGMVVAWYGPTEENNQTETNFRVILDQAQANGISALLSVDLSQAAWFASPQDIVDGMRYAIDVHAQHPAYFRYNGRPVFFFWFQGRYALTDWASIRQQVDPDRNTIWIAEGIAPDAMPTFDGLHLYTISWSQNVFGTLAQWAGTTRSRGGIWVATAMPGWDNTYTQQSERYVRDRENGAFYRDTFAAAAATNPEMVVITSWNEWWEGSHIEPSVAYGDFYLNLTRDLVAEYKAGAVSAGGSSAPPAQPTIDEPLVNQPPAATNAGPVESTATPTPLAVAEEPAATETSTDEATATETETPTEEPTATFTQTLTPTPSPTPSNSPTATLSPTATIGIETAAA